MLGTLLSKPRKASILAVLLLDRSVLVSVVRWALACSSILTTTKSLTRKARASVKSSEADRPSCHRLPGEAAASSPLVSAGSL